MEEVGLIAVLKDEGFQEGIAKMIAAMGNLDTQADQTAKHVSDTSTAFDGLGDVAGEVGSVLAGAVAIGAATAAAAFAGLVAASKHGLDVTLEWSENMDKLGDQFGMTGEAASAWTVAMRHVGLTVDEGAAGLNFFTRNLDEVKKAGTGSSATIVDNSKKVNALKQQLADANTHLQRVTKALNESKKPTDAMKYAVQDAQLKVSRLNAELAATPATITKAGKAGEKLSPFAEALQKLGVSAYDAKGKLKTFDEIMPQIMDAFEKLPVGVNSSALAMDLFGARGGTKFLDFLRQGSAGLKDAKAFADEFGLTLSTDTVNAAEEFGFVMNDLTLAMTGVWNQIGTALLPIIKDLATWIRDNVLPIFSKWAKEYAPGITTALRELGEKAQTVYTLIYNQRWDELAIVFWNWIERIQREATDKLGTIANAILTWAESDAAKTSFATAGEDIGKTIIDALKDFWGDPGTGDSAVMVLTQSMLSAVKRAGNAIREIGVTFGSGLALGIIEGMLGRKLNESEKGIATSFMKYWLNGMYGNYGGAFDMGGAAMDRSSYSPIASSVNNYSSSRNTVINLGGITFGSAPTNFATATVQADLFVSALRAKGIDV